ncbi:MAG: HlyD family efflux transporter periplasmic adaptor subunit [Ketobacteraceae bacterium]|nr:HlyD family efflux transporter periplasmic adaptor subunit [Ketobacteraceae bacterium]
MAILSNTKKVPLLIIAAVAGLITLMFVFAPSPEKKDSVSQDSLVDTLRVTPETHTPTLTLYGRVESPYTTTLSASTPTFVEEVLRLEGQRVTRGEVLIQLDSTDARLILTQREADLMDIKAQIAQQAKRHQSDLTALDLEKELLQLADRSAERYENLVRKNVASDTQRDEALQSAKRQALSVNSRELAVKDHPNQMQRLQAQLARAQALRDQAALDLERTRITAPFNGRITDVMTSPGNRVRQGDPLISLYDTDRIEVRAQIPTRYLSNVRSAIDQDETLKATLTMDEQRIPMTLTRLSGNVSESRGGIDGFFKFDNPDQTIELGRAVELALNLAPVPDSVALPPMAIYGQSRIYGVNNDDVLQAITIRRAGEINRPDGDNWVLVTGDIPPGTRILTTQLPNAISGLKVSVKQNEADNGS